MPIRFRLGVVTCLTATLLCACGGSGDDPGSTPAAGAEMTGRWLGEYTHPDGARTLTLDLVQSGNAFSGTWLNNVGGFGDITGTVSGSGVEFRATYSIAICSGLFLGSGTVGGSPLRMDFTMSGSDCGTPFNDLVGYVVKQP